MKKSANIILTGFMGTGKSTIGKKTADRLGWIFRDTDVLIEEETGMAISTIFTERGESYFRALEQQVIERVCHGEGQVIATGGGAMTNEKNVHLLKENGTVICLIADPEIILSRIQGNTVRPLLQGEKPLEKIKALLTARAEAYAKADVVIDTSHLNADEVVEALRFRVETILRA